MHRFIVSLKSNSPQLLKSRSQLLFRKPHECSASANGKFTDCVRGDIFAHPVLCVPCMLKCNQTTVEFSQFYIKGGHIYNLV